MSRYTDADALKERLIQNIALTNAIDRSFSEAPSIEIIRCKECKWAEPNREGDYDCKCHIPTFRIKADGFCSYGERREP